MVVVVVAVVVVVVVMVMVARIMILRSSVQVSTARYRLDRWPLKALKFSLTFYPKNDLFFKYKKYFMYRCSSVQIYK